MNRSVPASGQTGYWCRSSPSSPATCSPDALGSVAGCSATSGRHGIPVGRIRPKDLARRGVTRLEARAVRVQDGRPVLADGTVLDVAAVVWCTGGAVDFGWIDLPILGHDGWPREYRGVAEEVPGLYFCGLLFQYAVDSSVLPGVGRDAAYVAEQIDARTKTADPMAVAAKGTAP